MILIVFSIFVVIGQLLNVAICLAIDQIVSPIAGALAFVAIYMLVFAGAWILTLFLMERRRPDVTAA